jgi:hypothetical protein
METLDESLTLVGRDIGRALAALEGDGGASPVLRAVLAELDKKSRKAEAALPTADAGAAREMVVELEQAGDSAKAAVLADTGVADNTRKLVVLAHDSICLLKKQSGAKSA